MTAKEKAKKIVNRYLDYIPFADNSIQRAKECALIAVNEMLDFRNALYINEGSLAHQWLLDVKQEIELL